MSRRFILDQLRTAARKGDRTALLLGLDQMKTLAYSPRYWERYLELLGNPLARLVDLLVIKQGDRIARQKGWVKGRRPRAPARGGTGRGPTAKRTGRASAGGRARPRSTRPAPTQPWLFPDWP